MIEKAKALLQRYPLHSKVLVIGFFAIVFLILIIATLGSLVSEENTTVNPTPTPRVLVPGEDYVEGQITAKFNEGLTDDEISSFLEKYKARISTTIESISVKVIEVPVGQEEIVAEQLREEGIVEYAELDYAGQAQFIPNDEHFPNQYGLRNTGQPILGNTGTSGADINADEAWDVTRGSGIRVAILDSGIDVDHPDLSSKIAALKVFVNDPMDDRLGHGAHVAGIVSAVTNNVSGVAGSCPDCQLMIGKVIEDRNFVAWSVAAQGIEWAVENGAQVINLSFGGSQGNNTLENVVEYAFNNGVVVVAAAGNNGTNDQFYPSVYTNVVAVTATDNRDQKVSFSNYGSWVNIAAPGNAILSTMPTFQNAKNITNYGYLSGTSMASPMVAGVAGLIWAANPNFTNQQVVDRLYETADPIEGTGTLWQYGRVNAAAAVATESAVPDPDPDPVDPDPIDPDPQDPVDPDPVEPVDPDPDPNDNDDPPPFVCGGSPDNICTSPTVTIPPDQPVDDCLDPRGTREHINDWVDRFVLRVRNYINAFLGNSQEPPPPPVPCVTR